MKYDSVPASQVNESALVKNIYPTSLTFSKCPLCGGSLKQYTHAIPISTKEYVKMNGLVCFACDAFFTSFPKLGDELATKCTNKNYVFHFEYAKTYNHAQNVSLIKKLTSAYCQIILHRGAHYVTYIIVCNILESDPSNRILHYSSLLAKRLLTAIYLGNQTIQIDDNLFTILQVKATIEKKCADIALSAAFLSNNQPVIYLDKNGGYYTNNPDVELVDLLVFSQKSQLLECLRVSYHKTYNEYTVSPNRLREFQRKHGIPYLTNLQSQRKENGFGNLAAESKLKAYGYSVGKDNGMSLEARHDLLATLVDMGILTIPDIVRLLEFLISSHKRNLLACEKWNSDLAYIQGYKANPKRFIFMQGLSIRPKKY